MVLTAENSELNMQRGELENIVKKNENVCLNKEKPDGEEARADEILRDDIYKEKLDAKRRQILLKKQSISQLRALNKNLLADCDKKLVNDGYPSDAELDKRKSQFAV